MAASAARRRCACSLDLDRFCCCSLEVGVFATTLLLFVNSCLAFAGEAALYLGLLSAVASQITGSELKPGEPLSRGVHGVLIGLGLYALLGAGFGAAALWRRSVPAATGLFVVMTVDVVLSIAVASISFLAGSSINVLVAQLPTFALNIYLLLVVRSWRLGLVKEQQGQLNELQGGGGGRAGAAAALGQQQEEIDAGIDEADLDLEDDAAEEGAAAPQRAQRAAEIVIGSGDLDDEVDGDIGRGAAAPAPAKKAAEKPARR
jgi:hypothetical protein